MVRTPGSHPGNRGSTPLEGTIDKVKIKNQKVKILLNINKIRESNREGVGKRKFPA